MTYFYVNRVKKRGKFRKLSNVLTGRITKFLLDQLKKDQANYEKFYQDYGIFIKEGIITNHIQTEKVSCYSIEMLKAIYGLIFAGRRRKVAVV